MLCHLPIPLICYFLAPAGPENIFAPPDATHGRRAARLALLRFTIFYLLFTIYCLVFAAYYLLLAIYYLLLTIDYILLSIYYAIRRRDSLQAPKAGYVGRFFRSTVWFRTKVSAFGL